MDFIRKALNLDDIHGAVKDRNMQKATAILKKNPKVVNTKDKMGILPSSGQYRRETPRW